MEETWKDVDGYNGKYQISDLGRVRSYAQDRKNGKIKTGSFTHKGYLSYAMYDDEGNKKFHPVHRLVASAFLDNPNDCDQVNHKDEDKTNNRVDNLEWCDTEYNVNYGTRNRRAAEANLCCPATSKKVYSVDRDGNTRHYDSIGEAERATGSSHCNIVRALKGRRKTCGNLSWHYE